MTLRSQKTTDGRVRRILLSYLVHGLALGLLMGVSISATTSSMNARTLAGCTTVCDCASTWGEYCKPCETTGGDCIAKCRDVGDCVYVYGVDCDQVIDEENDPCGFGPPDPE